MTKKLVFCLLAMLALNIETAFSVEIQNAPKKMQIDLSKVELAAKSKVSKALSLEPSSLNQKGVWYHDIVASTDLPPLFDHSRVLFAYDFDGLNQTPLKGYWVALAYGLNGNVDFYFINPITKAQPLQVYYLPSATMMFKESLGNKEKRAVVERIVKKYPRAKIQYLEEIDVVTIDESSPARFLSALSELNASSSFELVELAKENYRVPFYLDSSQFLGKKAPKGLTTLDSLRGHSGELLKRGETFATRTSFAKPFGDGPQSPLRPQQVLVTVSENALLNMNKISSQLRGLGYKIKEKDILRDIGTIVFLVINLMLKPLKI